jgi:hypothetical protein
LVPDGSKPPKGAQHDLLSALPLIVSKAGGELAAVSRFADWSRYWWVDTSVD